MSQKGLSIDELAWWLLCAVEIELNCKKQWGMTRKEVVRNGLKVPSSSICLRHMINDSIAANVPTEMWSAVV